MTETLPGIDTPWAKAGRAPTPGEINDIFAMIVETADAHLAAVRKRVQSATSSVAGLPDELQARDNMLAAVGKLAGALKCAHRSFGAARANYRVYLRSLSQGGIGAAQDVVHSSEMLDHAAGAYRDNGQKLTLSRDSAERGEPLGNPWLD
jgi:hypothetical protein